MYTEGGIKLQITLTMLQYNKLYHACMQKHVPVSASYTSVVTIAVATVGLFLLGQPSPVPAAHCGQGQLVSPPSISSVSHYHGYQALPPQLTQLVAFPSAYPPGRDLPLLLQTGRCKCVKCTCIE